MKNAPTANSNESAPNKRDYTCEALRFRANALVRPSLYWLVRIALALRTDAVMLVTLLALACWGGV